MLVLQSHSLISSLMTWLRLMSRLKRERERERMEHGTAEISQVHSVELGSRHMTGWALHTQQQPNTPRNWRELGGKGSAFFRSPVSSQFHAECLQKNDCTTNIPSCKGQLCSVRLIAFNSMALTYPSLSSHVSGHTLAIMCLWSSSTHIHSYLLFQC